jgi:hypothetical protein
MVFLFLYLGTPCHPTTNAKPTDFNPLPTALYKCCFRGSVQNIMTHLAYDHINDSFFILSYFKTEIIGLMQGHLDQYPETQLVKTSHSSVPAYSSLIIYVFSKQFSS